ncbi:MAG TPA: questin oxidase family protein [Pseudomonadales bacterium]
MPAESVPTPLREHGRRYHTNYPPHDHSDHFPMTWLALGGLGAGPERQARFTASYLPRLTPLREDDPLRQRQQALLDDIERRGIAAVVADHLPTWICGWFREAYHPLIRLGYGVEFEVPEEVAAALAYGEASGRSDRLATLAGAARARAGTGLELLEEAAALPHRAHDAADFGDRAEASLHTPGIERLGLLLDDNLCQISYAALSVFAGTHDFFALHLVTASHAFRIVHAYAGPDADAILNLGVLAGYLAVGAPCVRPASAAGEPLPARAELLALCSDDEHDLKLAYSAWAQAEHWRDPAYLIAARAYLTRR